MPGGTPPGPPGHDRLHGLHISFHGARPSTRPRRRLCRPGWLPPPCTRPSRRLIVSGQHHLSRTCRSLGTPVIDLIAFAKTYVAARGKFLDAARARGLSVDSRENAAVKGPEGEALYGDVVQLGNPQAPHRLLMVSATHGIEGYCGSAAQIDFLNGPQADLAGEDLSIVLLHANNPYGFAWGRRVNEDNVDLNRNFVDFNAPLPENSGYANIRRAIVPKSLDEEALKEANKAITEFGKRHGFDRVQEAITRGQYHDAEGLYYGGTFPTWSNKNLRDVIRTYIAGADKAALIDFHTGLGPYGYGEIITEYEKTDPNYLRASRWYNGEATSTIGGDSSSVALTGTTDLAFHDELPDITATAIALEFGTVPSNEVFAATRADNWIHLHDRPGTLQWDEVKKQIRHAFYQEKDDWKKMVLERSREVINMTVHGLKGED
ncbi:MAG: DUF2817 domain-containing protein [Alphaproteobacteria bacterium]|nr:MAG: DUF2817 domain-containing protein [Alphaproteobacteria bacterium]